MLNVPFAYSGVSGQQFRRHPDIKPEHPDTLSIHFLLTLFLINNYHLVHIKLRDEKKLRIKCKVCGRVWIPGSLTDGRITQNSWQCPNDCKPEN